MPLFCAVQPTDMPVETDRTLIYRNWLQWLTSGISHVYHILTENFGITPFLQQVCMLTAYGEAYSRATRCVD